MSKTSQNGKDIMSFEDGPNLLTMLSGGVLVAVIVYFITGFFLQTFKIELEIIRYFMAAFVILLSLKMGTSADVKITINTTSGWLIARGEGIIYEGYAVEPDHLIVLQKQTVGVNNEPVTEYRLSLKIDDETELNIPLDINQVRNAIQTIEQAKIASPDEIST